MTCFKCGRTEGEGAYDIIPRAADGKLECIDCWMKREDTADRRLVSRPTGGGKTRLARHLVETHGGKMVTA